MALLTVYYNDGATAGEVFKKLMELVRLKILR